MIFPLDCSSPSRIPLTSPIYLNVRSFRPLELGPWWSCTWIGMGVMTKHLFRRRIPSASSTIVGTLTPKSCSNKEPYLPRHVRSHLITSLDLHPLIRAEPPWVYTNLRRTACSLQSQDCSTSWITQLIRFLLLFTLYTGFRSNLVYLGNCLPHQVILAIFSKERIKVFCIGRYKVFSVLGVPLSVQNWGPKLPKYRNSEAPME